MTSGLYQSGREALTRENELQKMLADEKMRSEQHRSNYELLKAEHSRLTDEFIQLQGEIKTTIEDTKLVQEKYKNLLDQTRTDLHKKQAECDDLRCQILNPDKLDLLRIRVQEDVEKPFREKFAQIEEETDRYRTELNKLKYEYSFLKAEYEHEKSENIRIIEEMKLRHEAEVTNLRKERDSLMARTQGDNTDAHRVRALQRENAQLHLKVKGLLSELEEIRAQREHLGLQSDSVSRLQSKQLAEHSASIKALETERATLKQQLESVTKELSNTQEMHTQFTAKIHDLEKENIVLKNRAEEVSHKSKVELTNLKMEMLKERGDLERQRDKLRNQIEDLKVQMDIQRHTISKQEDLMANKEREGVRRVQAAREEEWTKLHAVVAEKLELETRLQELERRKIDEEARAHAEREKAEERLQAAKDAREAAEKEALVLKTRVSHQDSLLAQLERERQENSELKTRLHRIESTYTSYVHSETELVDQNTRLKNQIESLREDLRGAREELGQNRNEAEKVVAQRETAWTEERLTLQHRLDELQNNYSEAHRKLNLILESNKQKKKKITRLVSKLKNKIQYLQAKLEETAIERDTLKHNISPEQHLVMKKKLNDIIRRHREFRNIILSDQYTPDQCKKKLLKAVSFEDDVKPKKAVNSNFFEAIFNKQPSHAAGLQYSSPQFPPFSCDLKEVPIGEHKFGAVEMSMHPHFLDLANQHEKELSAIKERLDQLDDHQRAQLEELKGSLTPVASSTKTTTTTTRHRDVHITKRVSKARRLGKLSGGSAGEEEEDRVSEGLSSEEEPSALGTLDTEPVQEVKCA